MRWAAGGSFWKEKLEDTPDALTQQGLVVGSIQQAAVSADRDAYAIFGEVSVPIFKNFELQGALRYDHYDTASQTSPKIAALWNPIPQLAFRASYTESFRMPSLKQLYGASEQGAANLSDEECVLLGFPSGCGLPTTRSAARTRTSSRRQRQDLRLRRDHRPGPVLGLDRLVEHQDQGPDHDADDLDRDPGQGLYTADEVRASS